MTITVRVTNEDSRENAVVEILSTQSYIPWDSNAKSLVTCTSEGILRGGESKLVYLCSDRNLEIIKK